MKKLLSLFLAILMCLALLPTAVAEATDADKTNYEHVIDSVDLKEKNTNFVLDNGLSTYRGTVLTAGQVQEKITAYINEIYSDRETRYWNKGISGDALRATIVPGKYKDCTTLQSGGTSNSLGNLTALSFTSSSNTCAGFACYMEWVIFGSLPTPSSTTGTYPDDYTTDGWTKKYSIPSDFQFQPGDLIHYGSETKGHYVVVWYVDGEKVHFIEANSPSGTNKIGWNRTKTASEFRKEINVMNGAKGAYIWRPPVVTTPEEQYIAQCTAYSTYGTIKTTSSAKLWNMPCSSETNPEAKSDETIPKGETVTVVGLYKNTVNEGTSNPQHYWYKTIYKGKERFFYADYAKVSDSNPFQWKLKIDDYQDINVDNPTYPTSITVGDSFGIKGHIVSTYNEIKEIHAYCFRGSVTSGSTSELHSQHTGLAHKDYWIDDSRIEKNLHFENLDSGTHTLAIKVVCTYYYAKDGTSISEAKTSDETLIDYKQFYVVEPEIYLVFFDATGGSVEPDWKTVTVGSSYGELPTPTRTGYTFAGWYTAASGGSQVTSSTTVTTASDHTLYAHWTANPYYFDLNGYLDGASADNINGFGTVDIYINGSRVADDVTDWYAQYAYGSTYEIKDIKPATGKEYVSVYSGSLSGTIKDTTRVVLQFRTASYTVSFNANGGSVSPTSKTVTYGSTYGDLPTPTREGGYSFDGWYTAASDGSKVTSETTVTTASNHTLYARWRMVMDEKYSFKIRFLVDGVYTDTIDGFGSYDLYFDGNKALDDETSEIRLTNFLDKLPAGTTWEIRDIKVKDGKSFSGLPAGTRKGTLDSDCYIEMAFTTVKKDWFDGRSFDYRVYNGHTYYISNETVTWYEAKTLCEMFGGHLVTIADDAENTFVQACTSSYMNGEVCWTGGTDEDNEGTFRWITGEPMSYTNWASGEPNNDPWNQEGDENYVFARVEGTWNDCPGYVRHCFICEKDSVLVNVTLDANGGIFSGYNTSSITYSYWVGTAYSNIYSKYATPSRTGYTFEGWYTEASNGSKVTETTIVTNAENHTLYAHWKKVVVEINGTVEWNTEDVEFKGTTPYVIANGEAQTPRFVVKDEKGSVIDAANYTYEYKENTNAGTGYVIVNFKGDYSGTARGWFKIYLPATENTYVENRTDGIYVKWDPVDGAAGYVIYRRAWSSTTNGWTSFERWNNTTGTSYLDGADDSHKVYAGTRYQYGVKAYFAKRTDPVSGATIGGNVGDNYNLGEVGPLKTTVRITTRKLVQVRPGNKEMTVKWEASKNFTGYQIQYSTDASFKENAEAIKIDTPSTYWTTVKELTSGATYYVRIRSYHEFENMTYFGGWSNVLDVTVK